MVGCFDNTLSDIARLSLSNNQPDLNQTNAVPDASGTPPTGQYGRKGMLLSSYPGYPGYPLGILS